MGSPMDLLLDTRKVWYIGREKSPASVSLIDLSFDKLVSRRHAKIWFENDQWLIQDLDSKHGTHLDGEDIRGAGARPIFPDIEIRIGETLLVVDIAGRTRIVMGNLVIEIDVVPVLNYSLVHGGIPVVQQVRVRNRGIHPSLPRNMKLEIPQFSGPTKFSIPPLQPDAQHTSGSIDMHIIPGEVESLSECKHSELLLYVDDVLVHQTPIDILPPNEWSHDEHHRRILAAFVLPNHPLIRKVTIDAQKTLGSAFTSSLHALTNGNHEEEVIAVIRAFYEYFRTEWNVKYQLDPPDSLRGSQRIRTPAKLLSGVHDRRGAGTCIDLVLLMASCLESVHLQPIIAILERSEQDQHALLACWLRTSDRRNTVIEEKEPLLSQAIVIECTGFARTAHSSSDFPLTMDFEEAVGAGTGLIYGAGFKYAVDVASARKEGILPLPFSA